MTVGQGVGAVTERCGSGCGAVTERWVRVWGCDREVWVRVWGCNREVGQGVGAVTERCGSGCGSCDREVWVRVWGCDREVWVRVWGCDREVWVRVSEPQQGGGGGNALCGSRNRDRSWSPQSAKGFLCGAAQCGVQRWVCFACLFTLSASVSSPLEVKSRGKPPASSFWCFPVRKLGQVSGAPDVFAATRY